MISITSVGIDPGITGAVAVIDGKEITFHDTPTATIEVGKKSKNVMDIGACVELLKRIRGSATGEILMVTIEKVQAMPGSDGKGGRQAMGATSAFSFGEGFGIWKGIVAALEIPYQLVHPLTWKNAMMRDMTKEKEAGRIKAMQLYPQIAGQISLKKHHGRADALLMATYAIRAYNTVEVSNPRKKAEQPAEELTLFS